MRRMTGSTAASISRVALVTGCSSGIGRATALRLARDGWTVYATARRTTAVADLEAGGCRTLPLDVTDDASMIAAVSKIEGAHGAVTALVNNAGYSQSGAIEAVPMSRVRTQFETNVFGPARLIQLVLPGMRRQRHGRIVNLSSMGGKFVLPGAGYYHATKFALEALSDALRFETQRFGIDVIVVEPGLIRSGFSSAAVAAMESDRDPTNVYRAFHESVGRITTDAYEHGLMAHLAGAPDDVARVVAHALTTPHPRTRYTVSPSATLLLGLRRLLGDRLWDRFLGRTYPAPT
jgi:NAD(P)-dependent dehydrogenase (short-subunit alcohol dehydrogenase family)